MLAWTSPSLGSRVPIAALAGLVAAVVGLDGPPHTSARAQLLGFVAVERDADGLVYVFDAEHTPFVVADAAPERVELAADVLPHPSDCSARCRIDVTFPSRAELQTFVVDDHIWRVRVVPSRWPSLDAAREAADADRWGDAFAALDAIRPKDRLERIAVATAAASFARRRGDTAGYVEAVERWGRLARRLDVPSEVSRSLRTQAFLAFYRRDFDAVFPLLDRAEVIDADIANTSGLVRAAAYRSLTLRELGRFRDGMQVAEEGRRLALDVGLTEDAGTLGAAIARIALHSGDYTRALKELDLAADRVAPHERAGVLVERGWTLASAMVAGAIEVDWSKPRADFERALRLARRDGLPVPEANALVDLAWLDHLEGRDAAAARLQGLDLEAHPVAQVFVQIVVATRAREEGRLADARAGFERALAMAHAGSDETSNLAWRATYGLAKTAAAAGEDARAAQLFDRALDALDRIARHVEIHRARALFAQDRAGLVDDAIRAHLSRGDVARAMVVADRARLLVLEPLAYRSALEGLDESQRSAWRRAVFDYERTRGIYERRAGGAELIPASRLDAYHRETERQREELQVRFDAATAILDASGVVADSVRLGTDDITARVGPGQGLLYFHAAADGTYVAFFVSEERIEYVVQSEPTPGAWAQSVAKISHLTIVPPPGPDPWSATHLAPDAFAPTSISFLPLAGLLGRREQANRDGRPVIVADPQSNLEAARREVEALHPGALRLVGPTATRRAVLGALDGATHFHFSGHGALQADRPWDARLLLAAGESLSVEDLLIVRPSVAHVVLIGCRTGRSAKLSRTAYLGLAEAFLLVSASSVVASTRDVEDELSRRFVRAFYAAGGADDPFRAYATVARDDPRLARPFYVAGAPRP
ncbi:MAG: CHAT domain-containing protein [Deltaproteobacteria bacterium]